MLKAVTLATVVLFMSGCESGLFTTPSTGDLMTPDHSYEIDTWGSNSEIYEFTPKSNTNKSCVMLMLDDGSSMGLQCFDKVSQ